MSPKLPLNIVPDREAEILEQGVFRRVFDEAAVGMILLDIHGRFLQTNDFCCRMLGYHAAELLQMGFRDLTHPDDLPATERYLQRLLDGRQTTVQVEKRYVKKDGSAVWLLVRTTVLRDPNHQPQYLLAFLQDITGQHLAEEALIESEKRYRTIFETAGSAMVIYRQDTTIVLANSEFCNLCGVTRKEVEYRRSWTEFIAPGDLARMLGYHRIRRGQPTVPPSSYESHVIDNEGRPHEVIINVGPIPDSDLTAASLLDMAGLRKVEEERALLAAAIEQAAEGLMVTDHAGMVQYVNPAFERMSGFSSAELMNRPIRLLGSKHDGFGFPKQMWQVLSNGGVWSGRFTNKRKDGSLFDVETTVSPVRVGTSENVTNFVAQQRDCTNEAQLERQLRQAQKLEAIGTLAGGIAHDFNNILASIIGYTEIALHDYLGPDHPAGRLLKEVIKAGGRARDLAEQILTFSRRSEQSLAPVSLDSIIKEALRLLRATLPTTIAIKLHCRSQGGVVMADPTGLHQVVLNLCTNAAHAMGDRGGTLEISIDDYELATDKQAEKLGLKPGVYQILTVSDSGRGMDRQTIERIFDPYFTTKGPGEGTGLGLALVHGIVTGLGGAVQVQSEIGTGSSFKCWLPLAEEAVPLPDDEDDRVPRGSENILLVDDESSVVAMASEMLGNLGYHVRPFTDSRRALEAFTINPAAYDLVITDQTMPGVTGLELAAAVKAARPDCPVLICSGYAEFAGADAVEQTNLGRLLRKPLTRVELARSVRQALGNVE